jgi:hypothetical protein
VDEMGDTNVLAASFFMSSMPFLAHNFLYSSFYFYLCLKFLSLYNCFIRLHYNLFRDLLIMAEKPSDRQIDTPDKLMEEIRQFS